MTLLSYIIGQPTRGHLVVSKWISVMDLLPCTSQCACLLETTHMGYRCNLLGWGGCWAGLMPNTQDCRWAEIVRLGDTQID